MSLINQMLQDLEQRRVQSANHGSPLVGIAPSGSTTPSRNSLNAMLLVAVVVMGTITGYLIWSRTPAPIHATAAPMVAERVERAFEVESDNRRSAAPGAIVQDGRSAAPGAIAQNHAPLPLRAEGGTPTSTEPTAKKIVEEKSLAEKVTAQPVVETSPPAAPKPIPAEPVPSEPGDAPGTESFMEKSELPLTAQQRAQQSFQQAVTHLGRGDQEAARAALTDAIADDPVHLRARETLAVLQLNTGRKSEAEALLRDGLMLDPSAAPLAKLYSRFLLERNDTAGAAVALERALPNARNDADYLALFAAVLARAGRHAEAAQVYESVLSLRPNAAPWWMGLALSLEALGNGDKALFAYEQALRGGLDGKVAAYVEGRIQTLRAAKPAEKK